MFKKNGQAEQIGKPLSLEDIRKKEQEKKGEKEKAKDSKK